MDLSFCYFLVHSFLFWYFLVLKNCEFHYFHVISIGAVDVRIFWGILFTYYVFC